MTVAYMKNKVLFTISSIFLIISLASLFLPIDTLYIYAINLGMSILAFVLILVILFVKKEKRFLHLALLQLGSIFIWYALIKCHYSPYRIGWKLYLCLLIFPISLSTFFLVNQVFSKRKILLRCFYNKPQI